MNQETAQFLHSGGDQSPVAGFRTETRDPEIDPACLLGVDSRFSQFDRLGTGGYCNVFSCWDSQRQDYVALKRLRPQQSSRREDVQQFLREPNVMSKIESPWVPAVFDLFPERMYKPYFTMEIVDGFNLCRVLSGLRSRVAAMEERFDLMTLLRLIVRSAEGLAAAHEAGCIHRDVKPENLIIDDEGNLKIVDWGISLDESEGAARDSETQVVSKKQGSGCVERRAAPNSKSDTTIGTPLYMSPEQIRDPTRVDARTDVFSLGAVLYDCLALTTLIHGTTREHVFRYTLGGDYVKPSDVTLRSEVPAAVEEVCMRATRPRAEERFASMDEFRAALVAAAGL